MKDLCIKVSKVENAWNRGIVLDSKNYYGPDSDIERGKLYEWNYSQPVASNSVSQIQEIDAEIDGKLLSKLQIKDISCST